MIFYNIKKKYLLSDLCYHNKKHAENNDINYAPIGVWECSSQDKRRMWFVVLAIVILDFGISCIICAILSWLLLFFQESKSFCRSKKKRTPIVTYIHNKCAAAMNRNTLLLLLSTILLTLRYCPVDLRHLHSSFIIHAIDSINNIVG